MHQHNDKSIESSTAAMNCAAATGLGDLNDGSGMRMRTVNRVMSLNTQIVVKGSNSI